MLKETSNGIVVPIKVMPRAHQNEIIGWEGLELKIRIQGVPEKGKANDALLRYIAKHFGVTLSSVNLISGESSRHKRVCISDLTLQQVMEKLPNKLLSNVANNRNKVADGAR